MQQTSIQTLTLAGHFAFIAPRFRIEHIHILFDGKMEIIFEFIIYFKYLQENDSNKIEASEKGSAEYDNEKEAADSGEKDSDSNNLSNHSSPNKSAKNVSEINEKEELKLSIDASNEKDSDKQSDNEENSKQSIKPYVFV